MQWMTMTSFVPCHALHAPEHAAASPFGPLNHSNDFFRPSCRSRLYMTGTGKSRYAGFCLVSPTPRWIADQGFRAPSTLDIATQNIAILVIKHIKACYGVKSSLHIRNILVIKIYNFKSIIRLNILNNPNIPYPPYIIVKKNNIV